jgi:hypothetical protein
MTRIIINSYITDDSLINRLKKGAMSNDELLFYLFLAVTTEELKEHVLFSKEKLPIKAATVEKRL